MIHGRLLINGDEVMKINPIPKEIQSMEKAIKQALNQSAKIYDIDINQHSISVELDLGDGYHVTYYKTKNLCP